jgi:hypothetical protein
VERCALAVSAAVGPRRLRDPALATLRARAHVEAQRVLSARAQLARVGAAAERSGWTLVVLKGAVPLLARHDAPDLMDIDFWGSPGDAHALAAWLDASGFTPEGKPAAHRLAVRTAPETLPVEIHTAVPGVPAEGAEWGRLRRAGALWTLAPADHAWHLLVHATEQHLERRGRIRELLLLRLALDDCGEEALDALRLRVRSATRPAAMLRQMEMAARRGPGAGASEDRFGLTAACGYILTARRPRAPAAMVSAAWRSALGVVARREGGGTELGGTTLGLPSANPALALLRRVAPRAERQARRAVRHLPEWAMAPAGRLLAAAAVRAVDRLRDAAESP